MTKKYFVERNPQDHLPYRVAMQFDYPYGEFEEVAAFRNPNDANKFIKEKNNNNG